MGFIGKPHTAKEMGLMSWKRGALEDPSTAGMGLSGDPNPAERGVLRDPLPQK